MVEHIGQKIKEIADNKGISVKDLSAKTRKTNSAIYDIFKKKDVSSELLREFSKVLDVPITAFLEEEASVRQTATGTGNQAGDMNKQTVKIGEHKSKRQEVYGRSIDELYISLLQCESEREQLRTELTGVKNLLVAKDEMIQVLKQR